MVPGYRSSRALTIAFALMLLAGCAGSPDPSPTEVDGATPEQTENGADPDPAEQPGSGGVEEEGPPPEEESLEPEQPAAGGGEGISIELAGLPVGGGEAIDLDGTWCQVLFWGETLPVGVVLEITAVEVGEPGGTLQGAGCSDAPPCVGVTISSEQQGGCAVTITPPSPDVELVRVRLDGVLRCPDQATCDALGTTGGSWVAVLNPTGGDTGGEEGTSEEGTGEGGTGEEGPGEEGTVEEGAGTDGDASVGEDVVPMTPTA